VESARLPELILLLRRGANRSGQVVIEPLRLGGVAAQDFHRAFRISPSGLIVPASPALVAASFRTANLPVAVSAFIWRSQGGIGPTAKTGDESCARFEGELLDGAFDLLHRAHGSESCVGSGAMPNGIWEKATLRPVSDARPSLWPINDPRIGRSLGLSTGVTSSGETNGGVHLRGHEAGEVGAEKRLSSSLD